MKFRQILCSDCKDKIRKAEAKYKKMRRIEIKETNPQSSGKVKVEIINQNKITWKTKSSRKETTE